MPGILRAPERAAPAACLLLRFLFLVFVLLSAAPARAELRVRVTRFTTGRYQSVGITVTDPIGGLDAKPGPIAVTMADGSDRRQTLYLEPTGRPGEWYGRFTPMSTGRYTGTAVLERGDEKEIGLVPLIRVRPSRSPGFLRLSSRGRRSLQFTGGRTVFPIGVRLTSQDLRSGANWRTELSKLRAGGVNFLELPVEWPETLSEGDRFRTERVLDAMITEAERSGRFAVMLDLMPPSDAAGTGADAYEAQLQRWVRRWSYSPALAAWNIVGAGPSTPAETRARFLRAVRAADSYRHLVACGAGREEGGADLGVMPWNWERPANQLAFLEVPDGPLPASPLPGETSWQMLAYGGVGLPFFPYRLGDPDKPYFLHRMSRMAGVARTIAYHVEPAPLTGVVPVDAPGAFCRYGPTAVGWLAAETASRPLRLTGFPRGRYRVRYWDPGNDAVVSTTAVWSDGDVAELDLPKGLQAVFVQINPSAQSGSAPPSPARSMAARPAASRPVPRPAPPKRVVRHSPPKPKRMTAAQRRHAAALAAKQRKYEAFLEAKRRKLAARKTRGKTRKAAAPPRGKKKPPQKATRGSKRPKPKPKPAARATKRPSKKPVKVKKTSKKSLAKKAPARSRKKSRRR